MKLADPGEFGLIDRFVHALSQNIPSDVIGIGDDCAVIPQTSERSLVVTTDLLVEGVHLLRTTTAASDLGHKALAVNLSDIAAMGGTPRSIFLSLALTADIDVAWLDEFFRGLRELTSRSNVLVLGGDTTRSPQGIVINITALGEINPAYVKLRSAALQGDTICVTRSLGDSAAGFRLLECAFSEDEKHLVQRHVRPEPAVLEGQWLGTQRDVHAMMDLSDGLHSDLSRLLFSSKAGAEIDSESLPISPELRAVAKSRGWNLTDLTDLAVSGGEDYGLLLTVASEDFDAVAKNFGKRFGSPLTAIGRITKENLIYLQDGQPQAPNFKPFKHF